MPVDPHKNFAYSTIATAPSPATSGTSLVVAAGTGTRFPAVSFNAVIWPAGSDPLSSNAEIVRVTAISTDTFTITRTQESTSARTVVVGDQIMAAITAKSFTDIEAGDFAGALTSNSPTAGLGYATGAGGTVTQLTSKSTGVTLNKICGAITTHNATLNSNTTVVFTVTNSTVAATDVPYVCLKSGNAANGYIITVGQVAAGSFQINILNGMFYCPYMPIPKKQPIPTQ